MSVTIVLPPLATPVDRLWHALLDLSERSTVPWSLVGGQMVLLHALEHGQVPPQISQDGDIVADIRADKRALNELVGTLGHMGFDVDGISAEGLAHRYVHESDGSRVVVDVLAPEGVGRRADLTTTPPGRTLEMPGGTQALERTEEIAVEHEGRSGVIRRPNLTAAIVGKAAAVSLPSPARHYRDLALLCALIDDPFSMAAGFTRKDRQRIRSAVALMDARHPAWPLVPTGIRTQGQLAFAVLSSG
ncbi:hypothetical protein N802_07875 [Knoellia sinensis KCTC 19936]|uniref:Uncharacterized protein n=1 Tax=Knoellia sinensis KCTC 19936 TaxID=1385520 RepID=A0A0A0JAY5_9MICO|nr:hypothetical protein [Knoellia sinensis]KGN33954.1 hypothetical protein N802_07875 [Knoellia sinensis KCTC 19936]